MGAATVVACCGGGGGVGGALSPLWWGCWHRCHWAGVIAAHAAVTVMLVLLLFAVAVVVVVVVVGHCRLSSLSSLMVVVVREGLRVAAVASVSHRSGVVLCIHSMQYAKMMWPVGVVGKCAVGFGSRKSRVRLSV
jgi:hypothetical protein